MVVALASPALKKRAFGVRETEVWGVAGARGGVTAGWRARSAGLSAGQSAESTAGLGRRSISMFFQAEDGKRDKLVTGVQTCALPISRRPSPGGGGSTRVQRAAGWGESLSSRAVPGAETVTPPRRASGDARRPSPSR